MNEVVLKFGAPMELLSDNATTFRADSFQELCRDLNTRKVFCTPYHSEGNGVVERSFRTWRDIIAKLTREQGEDFDALLSAAAYCYNTAVNDMTGESPFYLMFGRDPILPADQALYPVPQGHSWAVGDFREELTMNMAKAWRTAEETAWANALKMAAQFDRRARPVTIKLGDLVTFRNYRLKVGEFQKFRPFWTGIFRVKLIEDDGLHCSIVPVENPEMDGKRVHVNQIKQFRALNHGMVDQEVQDVPGIEPGDAMPDQLLSLIHI